MASEICYLTLKSKTDIESSTPEAKIWQAALKTIASQDGFQSQQWGRQLEHPDVVVLVIGSIPHLCVLLTTITNELQIGPAKRNMTSSSPVQLMVP